MALEADAKAPPKLLLLDPGAVTVSRANGRCDTVFDERKDASLLKSIGRHGQLTPVPVRKLPDGSYEVLAGTRRLGAVRLLHASDKTLKLKALLVEADDQHAWRIAYSENEDRTGISAYQTAKAWRYALENFCCGSQDKLAMAVKKDKTTVSHTLSLLDIPDEVRFALRDPEGISVNFGSKLLQALRSDRRDAMIEKAKEIAASDRKYPPSELLRTLLEVGCEEAPSGSVDPGFVLSRSPKGAHVVTIKPLGAEADDGSRRALLRRIELALAAALELHDQIELAA